MYGLTETAPFITICEPRPEHKKVGSTELGIIKARTGVELITSGELRVVDTDGEDVPADSTTLGEIVARGNVIMQGYYNDPEATRKVMGDGWFLTGDAAVMHPDGYVEIRDRIKDVIISGGENISSLEVEGVLLRHPAVQEAARGASCVRRPEAWRERDREGAHRAHARPPGPLQGAARGDVRAGAAEDGDGQDPEVRAQERRRRGRPPVGLKCAGACTRAPESALKCAGAVTRASTTTRGGGRLAGSTDPRATELEE